MVKRNFSFRGQADGGIFAAWENTIDIRTIVNGITGSISRDGNVKIDAVFGSALLIEETIRNMLLNAIKYTPPNGTVNLSMTEDDTYFIIEITDTGIGIPSDEKDKIFDEFYRASNARQVERDGTGLGLSISKEMIERHGGKMWVVSQEGQGSTFGFTLPKYIE